MKLTKNEIVKELVSVERILNISLITIVRSRTHAWSNSFKTYDYQKDILRDFNDYRFNVI